MSFLDLLKIAAACWFWSYVLTSTGGPGGVFEWAREHLWHGRTWNSHYRRVENGVETVHNDYYNEDGLLDCIYCLAFWVALAFVAGRLLIGEGWLLDASAVAGVAMLLHGYTGHRFANG